MLKFFSNSLVFSCRMDILFFKLLNQIKDAFTTCTTHLKKCGLYAGFMVKFFIFRWCFLVGWIFWDDENDQMIDAESLYQGYVPAGIYERDTLIYTCCRTDGDKRVSSFLCDFLPRSGRILSKNQNLLIFIPIYVGAVCFHFAKPDTH